MERKVRVKNRRSSKDKLAPLKEAIEPSEIMDNILSKNLKENLQIFNDVFSDCSDVVLRELKLNEDIDLLMIFIDGMVSTADLHEHTIYALLYPFYDRVKNEEINMDTIEEQGVTVSQVSHVNYYSDVMDAVLSGDTALLMEGSDKALIINARGGIRRGVEEPSTESAVRGPREGFTENIRVNTGLLRYKIKSPRLKTVPLKIGEHTRTNIVLAYIDGFADPKVIKEVKSRLEKIEIDGVLESTYIEELIEDSPFSPFPEMQYTERPDTVAAQLLEGRFAIFVEGTPFVLIAPVTFWSMMQASEDYYERYMVANLTRWLRYLLLPVALYLPGLYVAVITFHQDMLPTSLLLSIAAARETIPFPALIEALIMELSFEALREAGVRLPKLVGQAVSIVGALVIGSAAVEAGIVSAPMVMVVAVTGIASFSIPRYNMAISIRMLRFPMMLLAGAFGLLGLILGTFWLTVHMSNLRSFGVPYLSGIAPLKKDELKDIFARVPWWSMILRPKSYMKGNLKRLKRGLKPSPNDEG